MNNSENLMLDMLKKGRDHYGVVAVKAEFEAEGTRPDELLRLLDMARRADLKVALKIGGCEAISDLLASRLYGIDYIIAPMVETPYALSKFADARDKVYGKGPSSTQFLFNLETQATLESLEDMLPIARERLDGIVFGRVDFTLSRGMPRGAINAPEITTAVLQVADVCARNDLDLVVGGSVAVEAAPALRSFRQVRLDRFETRKVIFDGAAAESPDFEDGIANAMAFELAWLENKQAYYQTIGAEDQARIKMMRDRVATANAGTIKSVAA
ncbi:aldolase/citrate lyase family protein [Sphingobium sp.]|uniref:aldolase/citrate lyase family protein n=1 Tax=Sphingobium sp. TaxID=1912891 RepID=UPI003B3AE356